MHDTTRHLIFDVVYKFVIIIIFFLIQMARGVYAYFVCKLIELLDTVFFVMRKKQRQISFLHVYHHGMMPICAWIGVRFVPGGHGTLLGVINSFIHILMYTYYMLSAFGPEVQKYLWWKKYLTSLQLVQFTIILVHNLLVSLGLKLKTRCYGFLFYIVENAILMKLKKIKKLCTEKSGCKILIRYNKLLK